MASNLHAVAASAINVITTTETTIATLPTFNENQVGDFAEGIAFSGNVNFLPGTGTTAVVIRIRKANAGNAIIGVVQTQTVTAGAVTNVPIAEIDPTLIQVGASYFVTLQQTGASANGTVNRVVFECEGASAFE